MTNGNNGRSKEKYTYIGIIGLLVALTSLTLNAVPKLDNYLHPPITIKLADNPIMVSEHPYFRYAFLGLKITVKNPQGLKAKLWVELPNSNKIVYCGDLQIDEATETMCVIPIDLYKLPPNSNPVKLELIVGPKDRPLDKKIFEIYRDGWTHVTKLSQYVIKQNQNLSLRVSICNNIPTEERHVKDYILSVSLWKITNLKPERYNNASICIFSKWYYVRDVDSKKSIEINISQKYFSSCGVYYVKTFVVPVMEVYKKIFNITEPRSQEDVVEINNSFRNIDLYNLSKESYYKIFSKCCDNAYSILKNYAKTERKLELWMMSDEHEFSCVIVTKY